MKEFFKYARFYLKLTEGKILIFVIITFIAAGCETFFALSLMPIAEIGQKQPSKYSVFVYDLLKNYGIEDKSEKLFVLLCMAAISIIAASLAIIATKFYIAKVQAFMLHKVQMKACPKLFATSYGYFISKKIGFLNNAIMQQVPSTGFAFKHFATILNGLILTFVYLSVPMLRSPFLILILFVCLSPMLLVLKVFNRKSRYYSMKNVECYSSFNNILLQIMSNFKYIKATSKIEDVLKKVEGEVLRLGGVIQRMAIWGSTANDIIRPYAIILIFAVLFYSVSYQNASLIETGYMFGFLYMAYQKSVVVPMAYQKFLASTGAIKVYEQIIEETEKNPDLYEINKGGVNPDFSYPISMKDVTFSYAPELEPALNKISLEIPPKQSIAILGESGSGKSTMVNLLVSLLKPQSGSLAVGNDKYDDCDITALRNQIGYITQEPVVFNDTVSNNISMWHNADKEDIINAAKKAHAHSFIEKMPEKYETLLGDHGTNISGGQRQRLTIARELYHNPPVMIFDEATSSLDSKTEDKIQKEIDELKGERTIIIIAHRLSTIKNCDHIYVMDKGEIVEEGTYKELLSKNGLFTSMINRQTL